MVHDFNKDKFKKFWRIIWKLSTEKDIFFNASAITFNLFICAIPFILILISILGYILSIDEAFQELVRYGRELFPSFSFETQSGDVIEGAITIETMILPLVGARRVFGIIGIIILLFVAQGLFHTLKHVIFDVFEIEDRRHPLIEFVYNFFTFGVIGGVFIFFSMAISLISLFTLGQIVIPFTDVVIQMGWLADFLTNIVPIIFTFLLFYVIFRYISEKRIDPKTAIIATGVYTVLFEVAKYGISVYLEYALTAYRYFYQGYTILIIIAIWAFYSAALFVISAIIARAYRDIFLSESPAIERNPYTAIS
ncbi:MAG: YihY/virulence factor BrkB family protein [Balneolaceae bacterium]